MSNITLPTGTKKILFAKSEIKSKNLYNQYLEKMKITKPSYFQNIKLFESLKI